MATSTLPAGNTLSAEQQQLHINCSSDALSDLQSSRRASKKKTTPFPLLPFVTDQYSRKPFRDWFDVPAESYLAGSFTGLKAAAQLAAAVRSEQFVPVGEILRRVGEILAETQTQLIADSRRGAAAAMLRSAVDIYVSAAKLLDHGPYFVGKLEDLASAAKWDADRKTQKRADFVARMRAAKLAKRAASTATQGVPRRNASDPKLSALNQSAGRE